jgi:hypothetical protein
VLVLLMLALPLQAAIAAARTLCVAAAHHADVVATTAHGSHVHDHGVAHAPADADGSLAGDASAPVAADTCKLCAACGLTAAAPPAALSLSALPAAGLGYPAIHVPVPRNVADGLERPPRTN